MPTPKKSKVRAPLSGERIAEAALALIDAEGLAALSARKLAALLQCEAMSLYHHVDGMDGVLDAVVDRLFAELPDRYPADPAKALAAQARAYLALAEAHPHAFQLAATRRLRTPNARQHALAMVKTMQDLGKAPRGALREIRVLAAYLNGVGLALAAWRVAPEEGQALSPPLAGAASLQAVRADLMAGLDRLLDHIVAKR